MREEKGERILLLKQAGQLSPSSGRDSSYVQPSLNALTIVLMRSNRRLSHSSASSNSLGAVTDEMTRNVVRSKRTTSDAEESSRKCDRWERREEREGMRCAITIDQA